MTGRESLSSLRHSGIEGRLLFTIWLAHRQGALDGSQEIREAVENKIGLWAVEACRVERHIFGYILDGTEQQESVARLLTDDRSVARPPCANSKAGAKADVFSKIVTYPQDISLVRFHIIVHKHSF